MRASSSSAEPEPDFDDEDDEGAGAAVDVTDLDGVDESLFLDDDLPDDDELEPDLP